MDRRILLVDDDASLLRVTEKQLTDAGYEVVPAASGEEALAVFAPQAFDLVVTDIQMPGMDGLQLLAEVMRRDPDAAVLVITAYGTVESAVEAMKTGAVDFLEKPFRREVLLLSVERALRHRILTAENVRLRLELTDRFSFESIVGGSEGMKGVFRTLARVARTDVSVLVRGESGTGKELIARAIHYQGGRASAPFVAVNCAAIPDPLLESELFGHVKGAFTGADSDRTGRFREADGGSLLLDEIGEMKPELQVSLLRVLQDGEVRPVGAESSFTTDVRLIAATNRDLEAALEDETFRRDLYYRIAVVTIELPPLRERKDDIPLLATHFLEKKGAATVRMDPEFLRALREYPWPGNVRELGNVIERALVLHEEEGLLRPEDLPAHVLEPEPGGSVPHLLSGFPDEGISLAEVEKSLIRSAMEKAGGNQSKAARLLGITRQTLLYRLEKHELK
ncbi:MAG: sigma-54-dependent transcriptional regulator [Planctomycetota bacterium]|jgi:two-component system NtrC family response regulator